MKRILVALFCLIAVSVNAQSWDIFTPVNGALHNYGGTSTVAGEYVVGLLRDDDDFVKGHIVFIDKEGNYKQKTFLNDQYNTMLCGAIGLENGNALVVGGMNWAGEGKERSIVLVMVVNPDLDVITEHRYEVDESLDRISSIAYLEYDENGDIILALQCGIIHNSVFKGVPYMCKLDTEGNMLKTKCIIEDLGISSRDITGMTMVPNSNQILLFASGLFFDARLGACYLDEDFNILNKYLTRRGIFRYYSNFWKDDEHFIASTIESEDVGPYNIYDVTLYEVDKEFKYYDTLVLHRTDTNTITAQITSIAPIDENYMYVAGFKSVISTNEFTDIVVWLVDKDLNVHGAKTLIRDNSYNYLMECRGTTEGGLLLYGHTTLLDNTEMMSIWKLLPEDFGLSLTVNEVAHDNSKTGVYPNPTNEVINIPVRDIKGDYSVSIWDISGIKYLDMRIDKEGDELSIDVSSLESGTYFYEVVVGKQRVKNGKFIKN
ncbi:MAG: T9SS type A sorting domain-containing protein [Candidatus Limimorpha sp.]